LIHQNTKQQNDKKMTVSKILSQEQFTKAVKEGIYKILPSREANQATQNSKTGTKYFKVEYINPALYKSQFFVAV